MTAKGLFVKDMVENGQAVQGIYVVSEAARLQDKNGRPYWAFSLNDVSGAVPAKIWSVNGRLLPEELGNRSYVEVKGRISFFREQCQVRVDALRVLSGDEVSGLDLSDFLPPSPYDGEALFTELMALVERHVAGTPWERLVETWFSDPERRKAFCQASAARSMHHVGQGGLVAHTLEVCRICEAVAGIFPQVDRPALITAALFHDLGKTREMRTDAFETVYTPEGNILGHITLGVLMLEPCCREARLPRALQEHLFHMLLSHHGRISYGAVKEPATMEAVILSSADMIDARVDTMSAVLADVPEGAVSGMVREYGYSLYRPVPTAAFVRTSHGERTAPAGGGEPEAAAAPFQAEGLPEAAPAAAAVPRSEKRQEQKPVSLRSEEPVLDEAVPDVGEAGLAVDPGQGMAGGNGPEEDPLDSPGYLASVEADLAGLPPEDVQEVTESLPEETPPAEEPPVQPQPRKRGRPRKIVGEAESGVPAEAQPRKRGRPRKIVSEAESGVPAEAQETPKPTADRKETAGPEKESERQKKPHIPSLRDLLG